MSEDPWLDLAREQVAAITQLGHDLREIRDELHEHIRDEDATLADIRDWLRHAAETARREQEAATQEAEDRRAAAAARRDVQAVAAKAEAEARTLWASAAARATGAAAAVAEHPVGGGALGSGMILGLYKLAMGAMALWGVVHVH